MGGVWRFAWCLESIMKHGSGCQGLHCPAQVLWCCQAPTVRACALAVHLSGPALRGGLLAPQSGCMLAGVVRPCVPVDSATQHAEVMGARCDIICPHIAVPSSDCCP